MSSCTGPDCGHPSHGARPKAPSVTGTLRIDDSPGTGTSDVVLVPDSKGLRETVLARCRTRGIAELLVAAMGAATTEPKS